MTAVVEVDRVEVDIATATALSRHLSRNTCAANCELSLVAREAPVVRIEKVVDCSNTSFVT